LNFFQCCPRRHRASASSIPSSAKDRSRWSRRRDRARARHRRSTGGGGADLILAARNVERLEQAASEIRASYGRRVETAFVNIRDRASVEALGETVRAQHGQVDMSSTTPVASSRSRRAIFSAKGWQAVIDTNLTGTWNMTQVLGTQMLDGRGGSITTIIAVIGRGFPGIAHTSAARAGLLELAKSLAIEWGPKVRINCVAPGPIQTEAFKVTYDPQIETLCEGIPIARFGGPDEIAYAPCISPRPPQAGSPVKCLYVAGGQQIYGRNQALFDEAFRRG
jgi:citronellol/citronellal dehydrogenase